MRSFGRKSPLNELEKGDPNHSYAYAISLLALRDYSSAEMRRKLKQRGYLESAVEPVVLDLENESKLDDRRFGSNFAASRTRRGQGPVRIRQELRRSGLTEEAVDAAVKGGEDPPDYLALARAARSRKFGQGIPRDRKERARQARFLQYRGFSTDHIRAVLEGDVEDSASAGET